MANIEVELRSFLTKGKYEELIEYFSKEALLLYEDYQETHYFDCPEDLRIQKNSRGSKIWLKKGKLHDDSREEIEINLSKEDFEKSKELFETLGYKTDIKWFRRRFAYKLENNIKAMLDYTKGFGYILELEIISDIHSRDENLQLLKDKFKKLDIEISPKEDFENSFKHYKNNWRELTK